MKILVTGAAGFIGSSLIRSLLSSGYSVRALIRKAESADNLHGLEVELFIANILDKDLIMKAARGVDVIFHTASLYEAQPWFSKNPKHIYEVNVQGVRNICDAAIKNNVKKVILTSTAGVIGKTSDGSPAKEDCDLNALHLRSHYERSKAEAEKIFFTYAKKGVDVVAINPAFIFGTNDSRPSPTGETVIKFLNRTYPFYFDAYLDVASLNMVVDAHLKALDEKCRNQRYIVSHKKRYTLKEVFSLLEDITGIKSPKVKAPLKVVYILSCIEEFILFVLGLSKKVRPIISSEFVKYFSIGAAYDSTKAFSELNIVDSDFKETLRKEVNWYMRNGYIKRGSRIKYYKHIGKI